MVNKVDIESELRSCPFCGKNAKLVYCDFVATSQHMVYYHIKCTHCSVSTKPYKTIAGVRKAWNRRVK